MAGTWSVGTFTVKPGREQDFVQALAEVGPAIEGALAPPRLLRDREQPNVFLTITPWESAEAMERFRFEKLPLLLERYADVLESAVPRLLDEVGAGD